MKQNLVFIGSITGEGMYEAVVKNPEKFIPLFKDVDIMEKNTKAIEPPTERSYTKIKYGEGKYFIMPIWSISNGESKGCEIYRSLPPIRNDERLLWKKPHRSKDYWAQYYLGEIRFSIGYRPMGKVQINVCNHGKAEYLFDRIWMDDFPDNAAIIKRCKAYVGEMIDKLREATGNDAA